MRKHHWIYIGIGVTLLVVAVTINTIQPEQNRSEAQTTSPRPTATVLPTLVPNNSTIGREPMVLPPNYQTSLIHYATVDRIDGKSRNLYISPHALDALADENPLPDYTVIVIETFFAERDSNGDLVYDEDGRFIQDELDPDIHAAEKRSTWQISDLNTTTSIDWNFAAFTAGSGDPIHKDINDCFSCHESAASRDFVFSVALLQGYLNTETVQYSYCARPNRSICR